MKDPFFDGTPWDGLCAGVGYKPNRWGPHAIACASCGKHFARARFTPVHFVGGSTHQAGEVR